MGLALKTVVSLTLIVVVITIAWGCLVVVLDTHVTNDAEMWVGMLFDLASPSLPFLFMVFFSGTFSPGAGVEGFKGLRFLFSRFYLWCRLPDVAPFMEDCPAKSELTTYAILSGCLGLFLFLALQSVRALVGRARANKEKHKHEEIAQRPEYQQIQAELYKNATNKIGRQLSGQNILKAAANAVHPDPI